MLSASKTAAPSTGGYTISRSVRLRSSASAYLNRTPASQPSTWTLSFWVKRGKLGAEQSILVSRKSGVGSGGIEFTSGDNLNVFNFSSNGTTNAVYRDCSSWYHFVVYWSGTSAAVVYCNGVQQTMSSNTSGSSNIFTSSWTNCIGNFGDANSAYLDGYLTEINFIDGQALSPTSFGAYNSTTGVWQPIKYTGTYGTNGFYLNFSNNASTTTLGYDTSGNGNNWTTNNISLTSGSTYDSMTDVPTLTSATAANFAVLNPLIGAATGGASYTITQGNIYAALSAASTNVIEVPATMALPSSGQWYWEVNVVSVNTTYGYPLAVGISDQGGIGNSTGFINNYYYYVSKTGQKYSNGTLTSYGSSFTASDVIGVAFDAGAGTLTFYKNNSSQGTAFTGLSAGPYYPKFGSNDGCTFAANFGQRPFTYTPPSGFVALNTYNLPTPTIKNGASYMAATTYTGTGSTQNILNSNNTTTGVSFKPDFVWIKSRSSARDHRLVDSVRGATNELYSDLTNAAATDANGLTSFNSNGFTVGSSAGYNNLSETLIAWQWQAGQGTTSSNTNGSITSTVSVNATAGFSIVTYTGNGTANSTVGHGLGVTPAMIIVKARNSSTYAWNSWHKSLTAGYYIQLNTTSPQDNSVSIFPSGGVTSTVWNTGGNAIYNNGSGTTYVAYCFAAVAGFSAFGSYTGNGSTDGTFVYCGFRPRWIMLKSATNSANWFIRDTSRNPYNGADLALYPNTSDAEISGAVYDILSNGFKVRSSATGVNGSGETMIYAAFSENPFNYSLAR
jgi:SPRY domain